VIDQHVPVERHERTEHNPNETVQGPIIGLHQDVRRADKGNKQHPVNWPKNLDAFRPIRHVFQDCESQQTSPRDTFDGRDDFELFAGDHQVSQFVPIQITRNHGRTEFGTWIGTAARVGIQADRRGSSGMSGKRNLAVANAWRYQPAIWSLLGVILNRKWASTALPVLYVPA